MGRFLSVQRRQSEILIRPCRGDSLPDGEKGASMYARVARWEGAEGDAMRRTAAEINSDASSGPPEGVPAKGFLMLIDPDQGNGLAIALFETEEDLRTGDEVLNSMNPPGEGLGRRVAVETYEVAVDARV
jgi:hypothetical protein